MKKFRYAICSVLLLALSLVFMAGCEFSFGSKYTQFEIEYTKNLEFFVGEDYYDALLKGIGTKKNDEKEDVTSKMTVDVSEYNKNEVGTYKIYCEFEGIKLNYEVKVVDEMTDLYSINYRLQKAIDNTFKRDENGVFSYEAKSTSIFEPETDLFVNFNEHLIYEDYDGVISIYVKYSISSIDNPGVEESVIEMWYYGLQGIGTITLKEYENETVTTMEGSVDDYGTIIGVYAEAGLPINIYPIGLNDLDIAGVEEGTLTMQDNVYTLDMGYGYSFVWEDNVFTYVMGAKYTFPKGELTIIPTAPEATSQE